MTDTSSDSIADTEGSVEFALVLEGWAEDTFLVSEWRGREALAEPYRLDLLLASKRSDIEADKLLGGRATFTLTTPGTGQRPFHGVVTAASQLDRTDPYTFYRLRIEPQLSVLARYRYTGVYLGKTLPELASQVLESCGLRQGDDGDFLLRVHADHYPAHNFVCQYEETCLDFLSRRLEREGMYYYFDHSGERERVVLCDDAFFEPPFESAGATGWYRPQRDIDPDHPPVLSVSRDCEALPAEVTLADYSGGHAQRRRLQVSHAVDEHGKGQWVVYGEHFNTDEEGQRLAQVRAEAMAAESPRISGRSEVSTLSAGYPMELRDHFQSALNIRYRILEVHHEGRQTLPELISPGDEEGYHNTFVAMPLDKPYRTPRRTPIPHVTGVLSAFIDGEGDGDKAYLDEHGRYRVRLPVDHTAEPDARGSAWVRLATPYAGSKHGMHFPLLKGTEVLLAFIDGDPDRPVIVNALPNSENPSVVTQQNARENRIQTVNGNTLVMDDDPSYPTTTLTVPGAGYWTLGGISKGPVSVAAATETAESGAHSSVDKGKGVKDQGFMIVAQNSYGEYLGYCDEIYRGQYMQAVGGMYNTINLGVKTTHEAAVCLVTNATLTHEINKNRESKGLSVKRTVGQEEIKTIRSKHDSNNFSVLAEDLTLEADDLVMAGNENVIASSKQMYFEAKELIIKVNDSSVIEAKNVTISANEAYIDAAESVFIKSAEGVMIESDKKMNIGSGDNLLVSSDKSILIISKTDVGLQCDDGIFSVQAHLTQLG